jgi:hypothetical protein
MCMIEVSHMKFYFKKYGFATHTLKTYRGSPGTAALILNKNTFIIKTQNTYHT